VNIIQYSEGGLRRILFDWWRFDSDLNINFRYMSCSIWKNCGLEFRHIVKRECLCIWFLTTRVDCQSTFQNRNLMLKRWNWRFPSPRRTQLARVGSKDLVE